MEFYDNLTQSLQAVLSGNPDIRKGGEDEIRNCRDQEPRKFMATLTRDIANE